MSDYYRYRDENDGVGALVCGILSLLVCGIVLGPIAIHLGNKSDTSLGRAGAILGTIALILWSIGIILGLLQAAASS